MVLEIFHDESSLFAIVEVYVRYDVHTYIHTVIIRILHMIQFNIRNSISGIYHESNAT